MIDGTVPGWDKQSGDFHFDHHKPGGAQIQIDEIPVGCILSFPLIEYEPLFITTQLDADAVIAAAWMQLNPSFVNEEIRRKLRAIAFDCDYLCVPDELSDLAGFAAKAVAGMKAEGVKLREKMELPSDSKQWTEEQRLQYYSESFKRDVDWILDAVQGIRPFPGESGEADAHFEKIKADTERLLTESRLRKYCGCWISDQTGMKGYTDPRSFYAAIPQLDPDYDCQPVTLVIGDRKENDGIRYTLGSLPLHPQASLLDYSTAHVWEALSEAERRLNPDFQGWGGRAAVGGSSWNNPSLLSATEVIDIAMFALGVETKMNNPEPLPKKIVERLAEKSTVANLKALEASIKRTIARKSTNP
ncbi:MAG TPA: hypothetical protein V6C98_18075 [Thermosynechococcaceae cyanobacterium]